MMKKWIPTPEAVRLWTDASIVYSEIESHGVRVDAAHLQATILTITDRIAALEAEMRADTTVYPVWRRRFGDNTKLTSPEQLAKVLFGTMGYPSPKATEKTGRAAATEAALETVPLPFVRTYTQTQKLRKALSTYLEGLKREIVQHKDGYLYVHPSYQFNRVETFRRSAQDPNWMNNPSRNPEIGEMIRKCYLPRPGHQLLEVDYGQIEVRIPVCYHDDPVLRAYVEDPKSDMHKDTAVEMFRCPPKQVSKAMRTVAKNACVFPSFYGSYYGQIAPNVWEQIDRHKLTLEGVTVEEKVKKADGTVETIIRPKTVREHLTELGITELGSADNPGSGTYMKLMRDVEDSFWNKRFVVYSQWKKDWYAAYMKHGGCRFLTGFIMSGPHKRNDITNYAIQGSSSHCTLWSVIKIHRILKQYKFRSRVIGEIHDCINFDAHPSERDDVLDIAIRVMTQDIKRWAKWLTVPLVAEAEACPIDLSWHEKMGLELVDSGWFPAKVDAWTKKYGEWKLQSPSE